MSIEQLTDLLLTYRYLIIIPIAIIEGPILAMFVGMFIKLGYFSFIPAALIMIMGDFLPDSFYYYLGRAGKNWKYSQKILSKLDDKSLIIRLWNVHPIKTLIVSKLAFALSPALLLTAGVAHMPYKKYVGWSLIVTILQYGIFMAAGYWVGYSFDTVRNVKYIGIAITILLVAFFIVNYIVRTYARKKLVEMEHEVE